MLVLLHAVFTLTPLARNALVGDVLILRPAAFSEGLNWLAVGGHAFAHGSWSHVLLNAMMLIVFAIPTIRGLRARRVKEGVASDRTWLWLVIFFGGVVAGAFAQWGWWAVAEITGLEDTAYQSAVGASGGVSALFAAAGWAIGGRSGMVRFGVAWALINLLMVVFESLLGVGIAWAAHLGGFLGGMLLAPRWVEPFSTRMGL